MKKTQKPFKYVFILTISFYFFVISNAGADQITPSSRVTTFLKVRMEAIQSSEKIGRLHPGDSAQLIESVPYWYKIKLKNGIEGFVHKDWTKRIQDQPGQLEIHFIDVGQGVPTLIVCPDGKNILIDAGTHTGNLTGPIRDYILKVLDKDDRAIDTLIITEQDLEQNNILPDGLRYIPIEQTFIVGEEEQNKTSFGENLSENLDGTRKAVLKPNDFYSKDRPNEIITYGDVSVFLIYTVIRSNFSLKNTMSVALMVRYGDFEVILPGDATEVTENIIIKSDGTHYTISTG